MTISELGIGSWGKVTEVGGEGVLRRHLLDMGIIPGADVKMVGAAPLGDPLQIIVNGYTLTLRIAEAAQIKIEPVDEAPVSPLLEDDESYSSSLHDHYSHPGIGEEEYSILKKTRTRSLRAQN